MLDLFDILWSRTWWRYDDERSPLDWAYHWFNLLEGCAWLVFGVLVLRRCRTGRRSQAEVLYAVAFFTFALTDFREAWFQQSWLLWLKLGNVVVLFRLRRYVMSRLYPEAAVF